MIFQSPVTFSIWSPNNALPCLTDKCLLKSRDLKWYFFCPREPKYTTGARANRATKTGFWKATGKDRCVTYKQRTIGMIKTLIFHKGHAPKGERTDWVMHEYRLKDEELVDVVQVCNHFIIIYNEITSAIFVNSCYVLLIVWFLIFFHDIFVCTC